MNLLAVQKSKAPEFPGLLIWHGSYWPWPAKWSIAVSRHLQLQHKDHDGMLQGMEQLQLNSIIRADSLAG